MYLLLIIVLLLTAAIVILLGVVVVARAYRQAYAWHFLGIILSVAMWSIADLAILTVHNRMSSRYSELVFYIAPMSTPIFMWFFSISFPEGKPLYKNAQIGGSLSFLVGASLVAYDIAHGGMANIHQAQPFNVVSPIFPAFCLYGLYLTTFFTCSFFTLYRKLRRAKGVSRPQLAYTFYGIVSATLLAFVTNIIFPSTHIRSLIWLGPIFSLAGVAAIALAIVRYKLFDIRLAIIRSVTYIVSLGLLSAFYVGFVYVISQVLLNGQKPSLGIQSVNILVTLVIALAYYPLTNVFRKVSNRLFYRDAYNSQSFIAQLNQAIVENLDLDRLMSAVATVITSNFKAEYCVVGVRETSFRGLRILGTVQKDFSVSDIEAVRRITPRFANNVIITEFIAKEHKKLKQILERNDIAVLVRIVPSSEIPHEGLGYIALGPKKSGNLYGSQDTKVLDIISKSLLIAVQNALHFEEIQRFNATLQDQVDEATRKLRHSNQKLRQLDETKDDFISMASHQLRTPLTSVKGYLSMVLDGDAGTLNDTQAKMLRQAFTSSQRMVFLITDLLNISRLKTGKFLIDATPVDLSLLAREEVEQLSETAEMKQIVLMYDKPASFPKLMLDETKTRQVIMNFIDNAIYYTPIGGHIRVELAEKPATVELRVVDDGMGVPRSEQPHLFTKFYRATNARKTRPDGTGLGLFMAKKAISAQGGSIIFSSHEHQGSTFGFLFSKSKLRVPEHLPPSALHVGVVNAPVSKK